MTRRMTVTIAPTRDRVRILATTPGRDVLQAVLPPIQTAHRRAATTLLEGLSLWHGSPLSVVLSAESPDGSLATGLLDALDFGEQTLFYGVTLAVDDHDHRRPRLRGLGEFADLRRLALLTEASR
jgi:hypothetical protein